MAGTPDAGPVVNRGGSPTKEPSMHKIPWLLVAVFSFSSGDQAETNVARASRVRERLSSMQSDDLKVYVRGGTIHVSGVIESADDSKRILDAILQERDVKEIQLNLGIGQQPRIQLPRTNTEGNSLDQFDRPAFRPDELPSPFGSFRRKALPRFRGQ